MKVMKVKHVLMVTALTMMVGIVAVDSAPKICTQTCGNVEIPYPFGINITNDNASSDCLTGRRLIQLICNESILYAGHNVPVLNISIPTAQIDVLSYISQYCGASDTDDRNRPTFHTRSYTISSKENKFITIGYNSFGYLNSYNDNNIYSTGCLTRSFGDKRPIDNGTCSGIGCCQVDIPPRMWNISIEASNFDKTTSDICSYSFVVKNGNYTFSSTELSEGLRVNQLPMVLDWTVGDFDENCSTASSKNNGVNYMCKSNSHCYDNDTAFGYLCRCDLGYDGNPYHPLGCTDIDECVNSNLHDRCKNSSYCHNIPGNYTCSCPLGQIGDGTNEVGCQLPNENGNAYPIVPTVLGVGAAFILLFLWTFSYIIYHKRKSIKLREKFFEQNGGLILKQKLSTREDSSSQTTQSAQIFSRDQLNRATKNFDESLIIGKEGNKVNNESWKTRLKIAAEVAGALSYLHSSASIPIIHRDVKCDNILLDGTNTAKVSDFGASRLVPLDQTEVATMVQGTIGYLDPEYMQTSQLTEKSDVYSFGVVLVELLTGERPFSFGRPEERRSLAMHFLSCLKKDNVFDVIQEENKQEIKEVAVLAAKCLGLRGEERPSMKEVAMELEGMRLMDKHSWINDDLNVEENQYLLHESSSSIYETGDSSKHGDIGYDSLKDQVLIVLDDGR
ncbi:hypothetical protein TSUD_08690 [Trifolium subterraneum]|nr:hypothetical protein TSUD_08690 [Trifolium subterraneum]